MLINPYYPGVIPKNFPSIYSDIGKYYNRIFDTMVTDDLMGEYKTTPRYNFEEGIKVTLKDIYYYIDFLYDHNPTSVVDVGCGECIWKKWYPNIIGFDPAPSELSAADFVDFFDVAFSKGHTKSYDCGMALNSIHYINWEDIPKQIDLAMNMVKDRFLFTFNFVQFENKPSEELSELTNLFDNIINSLNYEIVLIDYPHLRGMSASDAWKYESINGHVRFILQHKKESI